MLSSTLSQLIPASVLLLKFRPDLCMTRYTMQLREQIVTHESIVRKAVTSRRDNQKNDMCHLGGRLKALVPDYDLFAPRSRLPTSYALIVGDNSLSGDLVFIKNVQVKITRNADKITFLNLHYTDIIQWVVAHLKGINRDLSVACIDRKFAA